MKDQGNEVDGRFSASAIGFYLPIHLHDGGWGKIFHLILYHISAGVYKEIVTLLRFVKSPAYLYFLNLMIMIYYLIAFPNDDECLSVLRLKPSPK